jgi:hypothetical protein
MNVEGKKKTSSFSPSADSIFDIQIIGRVGLCADLRTVQKFLVSGFSVQVSAFFASGFSLLASGQEPVTRSQ